LPQGPPHTNRFRLISVYLRARERVDCKSVGFWLKQMRGCKGNQVRTTLGRSRMGLGEPAQTLNLRPYTLKFNRPAHAYLLQAGVHSSMRSYSVPLPPVRLHTRKEVLLALTASTRMRARTHTQTQTHTTHAHRRTQMQVSTLAVEFIKFTMDPDPKRRPSAAASRCHGNLQPLESLSPLPAPRLPLALPTHHGLCRPGAAQVFARASLCAVYSCAASVRH